MEPQLHDLKLFLRRVLIILCATILIVVSVFIVLQSLTNKQSEVSTEPMAFWSIHADHHPLNGGKVF